MRKERKILVFFFLSLTTFYIFRKSDIKFFFFLNCPLINSLLLTRPKKKKMGLELRIRKEKKDGRFGHEDQSVSNNKRK